MTNRDTTLDDVSRRSGFHPGTVSRVLTRPGRVVLDPSLAESLGIRCRPIDEVLTP